MHYSKKSRAFGMRYTLNLAFDGFNYVTLAKLIHLSVFHLKMWIILLSFSVRPKYIKHLQHKVGTLKIIFSFHNNFKS